MDPSVVAVPGAEDESSSGTASKKASLAVVLVMDDARDTAASKYASFAEPAADAGSLHLLL